MDFRLPFPTFGIKMMVNGNWNVSSTSVLRTWWTIVAAVLGGLLLTFIVLGIVATQVLGYQVLAIKSESMEPALSRGDLIVTRPVNASEVEVGAVVVFSQGQEVPVLIAHRVVGSLHGTVNIRNSTTGEVVQQHVQHLQTQGDANPSPDSGLVSESQLKGTVWFSVPAIGSVVVDGLFQQGMIVLCLSVLFAWGVYEVLRFAKTRHTSLAQPASYGQKESH